MGISPRMTYMGALLTNPPLNTKAWAPKRSSSCAMSMPSSISIPPLNPSLMLVFTITAISFPAAFITFSMHMRINRMRLSSEPPYSSRRRLVYGDRNWLMR